MEDRRQSRSQEGLWRQGMWFACGPYPQGALALVLDRAEKAAGVSKAGSQVDPANTCWV